MTDSPLPPGKVGVPYSGTLVAAGGKSPYNWAITEGSLPAGLRLEASTGRIMGVATGGGFSLFRARVTDSAASATLPYSLFVEPRPRIGSVVSGGGLRSGPVAPGKIVSLFRLRDWPRQRRGGAIECLRPRR